MVSPSVQCYDCGCRLPSRLSVPCDVCLWKAPDGARVNSFWVSVDMCPPCARDRGRSGLSGWVVLTFLASSLTFLIAAFLWR
jgi:hypothetical protein